MLSSPQGGPPANLPPCTFRIELGLSNPIDLAVDEKSHVISLIVEMSPRPIALDSHLGHGQWRAQPAIYCPLALRIGHSSTQAATSGHHQVGQPFLWDLASNQKHPLRPLTVATPATLSSTVWELVSIPFEALLEKLAAAAGPSASS
jgi:hypothetical protein